MGGVSLGGVKTSEISSFVKNVNIARDQDLKKSVSNTIYTINLSFLGQKFDLQSARNKKEPKCITSRTPPPILNNQLETKTLLLFRYMVLDRFSVVIFATCC